MRAVMVMYDTLCRRFLPPYGASDVHTPNFERLAKRTVQFQNCYVGSMPCMPARRELHTGRYNFLHRSWGPLEPFDDSMPEQLSRAGIQTHKVTDHYHYWEDGGSTYHNRFCTYEFVRGQEGDRFLGYAGPVQAPNQDPRQGIKSGRLKYDDNRCQDWINRQCFTRDETMPQHVTFTKGLEYLRRNAPHDDWFCLIETFDPHEPFFVQDAWKALYKDDWDPKVLFDWAPYDRAHGDTKASQHLQAMYKALLSFCDAQLGRVLDLFDELDLWKDTMLIVNTDHGYLLGEHDWWAKIKMPFYQEIAHIPLWIWDPRSGKQNEKRESLVQTIDLAPTLLEYFGQAISPRVQGNPLRQVIENDTPIRTHALYGIHGGHVNITDGHHVYMRGHQPGNGNKPLVQYTHMPCHMRRHFAVQELQNWEKHPGFPFTQGCPVMAVPVQPPDWYREQESKLFDLKTDYLQEKPLNDPKIEAEMITAMVGLMAATEAPPEQYQRLGLPTPRELAADPLKASQSVHGAPGVPHEGSVRLC